jgi:hypothetical protein
MVAMFPAGVEWVLVFPIAPACCPCVYGCIRLVWVWGTCRDSWLVPIAVAFRVERHRHCSEGVGTCGGCSSSMGGHWAGKHICFHSDNMAVVAVLTSLTAQSPLLMHLLRCLSFFSACFSFHFSAKHISGVLNGAADALSRNHLELFSSLTPLATTQSTIPSCLLELLITTRPDWGSPEWTQLFAASWARLWPGHNWPLTQQHGHSAHSTINR